ncbi:hypothetical protein AVEN_187820-1 [Araneus ventricosus]|uniref:Uncharacterized protein n=1 Tax=Araneus ventricosus TaxID=182803 RepID=A0A4Y2M5Z4_ARAVE|nr:hypothetical protein AVEN_187820-1 [Araneus ventricosus]
MSIFNESRKCDSKILAEELGENVDDSHKLKDMKKMILANKKYGEDCANEWLNMIINERKKRDENERRNEEIQERRRQEENAERKRQEEIQIEEQICQGEVDQRKLEYE